MRGSWYFSSSFFLPAYSLSFSFFLAIRVALRSGLHRLGLYCSKTQDMRNARARATGHSVQASFLHVQQIRTEDIPCARCCTQREGQRNKILSSNPEHFSIERGLDGRKALGHIFTLPSFRNLGPIKRLKPTAEVIVIIVSIALCSPEEQVRGLQPASRN